MSGEGRQAWERRGVVIDVEAMKSGEWASHAQMPTPLDLGDGRIRLYFTGRDTANKSFIGFADVDAAEPSRVLRFNERPLIERGPLGAFDVDGMMPTAVCRVGDKVRLYYIGWSQRKDVPYHNAIGLAESDDGGETFVRVKHGPVVGTGADEPYFCGTADVLEHGGRWLMWYMSATEWRMVDGKPEPLYHIRTASSADGVDWRIDNRTAIDFEDSNEGGIARASVIAGDGGPWRMWYCVRDWRGYRDQPGKGYRIGFATSADGAAWSRADGQVGFANPPAPGDWDHDMQAYPAVVRRGDTLIMFYNGNEFGRHALGYAVLT